MKYRILFLAIIALINSSIAQTIQFKDENLMLALIEQGVDHNGNGIFENEELYAITKISLNEKNISDLSGMACFINLTDLNLRKNNISNFNLISNLRKLETLVIGDNRNLGKLDLGKHENLIGLFAFRNDLVEIKIGSKKLTNSYLHDNLFTSMNTENCTELHTLNVNGCRNLISLDLSENLKLV